MSTIAQELCLEIVEPVTKPSSTDSKKFNISGRVINTSLTAKRNVKPRQSGQVEKRKIVTKLEPTHVTGGLTGGLTRGLKFNKIVYKKYFVDTAVNTLVTGPLRCDTNCMTLIQKRDNQPSCRCNKKKVNIKGSSKEIQTMLKKSCSISNKSCTQCIETISCGTQFLENINGILKHGCKKSKSNTAVKLLSSSSVTYYPRRNDKYKNSQENFKFNIEKSFIQRPPSLRYIGAKHWAVTNYPTRGPDF